MKRFSFFLIFSICMTANVLANPLKSGNDDFIVQLGQIKSIPARTYIVNNLIIHGTLEVLDNQRQWLIFDVSGDAIIDGKIIYTGMRPIDGPINATAPDGTKLSFEHPHEAFGGDGGVGAGCGGLPGGKGALGTKSFGGGGGGGATATRLPPRDRGEDANGWRGGKKYKRGGYGAKRRDSRNGGLIYISVIGKFSGKDGEIFLNGKDGTRGKDGEIGSNGRTCSIGSAGGGGGSPGGDGGYIKIDAKLIGDLPKIIVDAGKGGEGGKGGVIDWNRGANGSAGEMGDSGYSDFEKFN
jgi:hypothetical protein